MIDLKNKVVLVTGASGFLGTHLLKLLKKQGVTNIISPRSSEYDLCNLQAVDDLFNQYRPQIVIHLAAVVGGIGANRKRPGTFLYKNALMGLHVIECAKKYHVKKTTVLGTICAYPKITEVPFQERNLWNGFPEETNAPYGIAKKLLLLQLQAYRQEFDFNGIYLMPTNLYGPHDNFDLQTSHVIPAMIRKVHQAIQTKSTSIVLWGTGQASRDFLFVTEAARAIVKATELYSESEPINLGSGEEVLIYDLALMIAKKMNYSGKIIWDASYPDGQPRRCLDTSQAKEKFDFSNKIDLSRGLDKTIQWYLKQK